MIVHKVQKIQCLYQPPPPFKRTMQNLTSFILSGPSFAFFLLHWLQNLLICRQNEKVKEQSKS